VQGDLIAASQSVEVGVTVNDYARIAGQTLLLRDGAWVRDDLLAAGYSLEASSFSRAWNHTGICDQGRTYVPDVIR
jgi:hypothetical protein